MNHNVLLKKIIQDNNSPNIIIYGINDVFTIDMLNNYIQDIYSKFRLSTHTYKSISYMKSNVYYEIDMKIIQTKMISELLLFL